MMTRDTAIDGAFLKQVAVAALIGVVIVTVLILRLPTQDIGLAALVGLLLSLLNAVAGTMTAGYAIGSPGERFLKIVLGGMVVRMAALLIVLFILIRFAGLHVSALTTALFCSYLVFLIMEVFSIQRMAERHGQ